MNSKNGLPKRWAMFSLLPVNRLSTHSTSWPACSSSSQRCEPRNPAPPVTRTFFMAAAMQEPRPKARLCPLPDAKPELQRERGAVAGMRRGHEIGAEAAVFGAQGRKNDRKPVAVVGVRIPVDEAERQAGAHAHACRIPAPRPPVVGGVVAAFVIAVEEGPGEKPVLRSDEYADTETVVVLPVVAFLEVIGEEARIEPHLDGCSRLGGARAQGEKACEGGSKHELFIPHLNSASLPWWLILYINTVPVLVLLIQPWRHWTTFSSGIQSGAADGCRPWHARCPPASMRSIASFRAAAGPPGH